MSDREPMEDGQAIEARLAAIIDSSFDAVIAKNLDSVITHWNPAAERLFGYTAEEAIGQKITMLIPDHLLSEETEIIRRIRANDRVDSYETVRRRKDGSLVHVSLTVSPIRNAAGEVVGASKIARDVTDAHESDNRIRQLLREINHRVKNQYAVILSVIRETGLTSSDIHEFQQKIRERIMALAASHDLLVKSDWKGTTIAEVVSEQLRPFGNEEKVIVSGPMVTISPAAVQNIGMALHELGTNSARFGVLSGRGETIKVEWGLRGEKDEAQEFFLDWSEVISPPLDQQSPSRSGFGTVVLERVTPRALDGVVTLERTPSLVHWVLTAPAINLTHNMGG